MSTTTTRERVEELLQEVLPRLEGLKEEAMAEIGRVRRDANAKISRHEEAARELEEVEGELEALTAEREELPGRAYRAGLDEEYALEHELTERYRNLRLAIESLEDRRGSLKEEMRRLSPNDRGWRNDAAIHHTSRVAGTAHEERRALEELRDQLVKALDDTVGPVAQVHNDTRALVETWSTERTWAQRRPVA